MRSFVCYAMDNNFYPLSQYSKHSFFSSQPDHKMSGHSNKKGGDPV